MQVWRVLAAVAAAGVVGTLLRAALADVFQHGAAEWPWSTFVANVAGAFVLGFLARRLHSGTLYAMLGAGLCGALTTFSTLQLELYDQIDAGHAGLAVAYAATSVAAGLAAVVMGDRAGRVG